MRIAPLFIPLLLLAGCGEQTVAGADPAAGSTSSTRATAPGLAAAVVGHLGGEDEVGRMRGGLLDMEDQRALEVEITLDDGAGGLHVSAHDPDYLPGDGGPDECRKEGVQHTRWGSRECRTLDDGTVVELIESKHGFSDDNRHGSAAMAMANGPRGYVQLMFETYRRGSDVDLAVLGEIVSDPRVGWHTTPEMNAEGEELDGFVTRDRVE